MSTAAGRAAPSAQAGADGVSRRDIAALVYNYLRSNGFAKVRPRAAALVARPSPPRVPTTLFEKQRSPRSQPARPNPPVPTPRPFPRMTLPRPNSPRRAGGEAVQDGRGSPPRALPQPRPHRRRRTRAHRRRVRRRTNARRREARGDGSQPARAADVRAARRLRHDDGGDRAARARPDVSRTADASSSSSIRRRRRLPGRRRRATRTRTAAHPPGAHAGGTRAHGRRGRRGRVSPGTRRRGSRSNHRVPSIRSVQTPIRQIHREGASRRRLPRA